MFPRLASRWALILLITLVRAVYNLTEQPGSSLMPKFPYMEHVKLVAEQLFNVDFLSTFLWGAKRSVFYFDSLLQIFV